MRLALELSLVALVLVTFFKVIDADNDEATLDVEVVMSDMPLTNVVTAARSVH